MLRNIVTIGLALALILPTGATAQTRTIQNAPSDYRHSGTETAFPLTVGEFRRQKVVEYNADGSDASASYELARDDRKLVSITVYIYPMPASTTAAGRAAICLDEYTGVKKAIAEAYAGATLIREEAAGTPSPRVTAEGRHAVFRVDGSFGGQQMAIRSHAYVYCAPTGKWFVQYRISWPAADDRETEMFAFMSGWAWAEKVVR